MSELIVVPGALGFPVGADDLGSAVMEAMVRSGELPSDFQVRLLSITDSDTRQRVARQDVLAGLGYGESSGDGYLTDPLPDCLLFTPYAPPLRPILSRVDTDYHMLSDMQSVARGLDIHPHLARSAWGLYVQHLDETLHDVIIESSKNDYSHSEIRQRSSYLHKLGLTAIRDDRLLGIYENIGALRGHGATRKRVLHHLLLDNHPELGPDCAARSTN